MADKTEREGKRIGVTEDELLELMSQAVGDSVVYCPECGVGMEPDARTCYNGHLNPLRSLGLI